MPTADEKPRCLARLVSEQGIRFVLDASPKDWPKSHHSVFCAVRELGTLRFEQYCEEAQREPEKTPWKFRKISEAKNLVQLTLRFIPEYLNEEGWRDLEPHIFGPFTWGVSCKTCGGRLWRALQDPAEDNYDPLAHHLQNRRDHRKECQCLTSGQVMHQERAVSELFSSRRGEYLVRDPEADGLLPKQGPDRIYGLRKTVELKEVLCQRYLSANPTDPVAGKLLSDAFHTSPFKETVESLLFPFLIIEFKSEKKAAGFYDIQNQTALPIRRLLRLQSDLRTAARTKASAVLNPLVWFFAFRGDDVRVYAAYIVDEGLAHNIEVTCLLDFRISRRDGALQMLLLVDYLLEWARDIYCPMVKHQLKLLAAVYPDTSSFHGGTNATTLIQHRKKRPFDPDLPLDSVVGDLTSTLDFFPEGLDTALGVVRSTHSIEACFRGLLLRRQDAQRLFTSLEENGGSLQLANKIIRHFRVSKDRFDDRCLVSERALNELEEIWTGKSRSSSLGDKDLFWTKIQYSTYLSHDWEQVRELSYIALSEEAVQFIQDRSEVKQGYARRPAEIMSGLLERLLTKIKEGSVEHNLAAAICRSSLSIPQAILASAAHGYNKGSMWDQDVSLELRGGELTFEIVLSVFDRLEQRRAEHHGHGLRESRKSDSQHQNTSRDIWPLNVRRLVQSTPGIVLVCGEYSNQTRAKREFRGDCKPNLCIFVLECIPRLDQRLGDMLREILLTWTIYTTIRRDWPNLSLPWGDRNKGLGFVKMEMDHYHYRPDQNPELVAASVLKWIELLGVPPGADYPRKTIWFDRRGKHWHHVSWEPDVRMNWKDHLMQCVDKHRKARGLNVEQKSFCTDLQFVERQVPISEKPPAAPPAREPRSYHHAASSVASEFGTPEAGDHGIETVDLTRDSD